MRRKKRWAGGSDPSPRQFWLWGGGRVALYFFNSLLVFTVVEILPSYSFFYMLVYAIKEFQSRVPYGDLGCSFFGVIKMPNLCYHVMLFYWKNNNNMWFKRLVLFS